MNAPIVQKFGSSVTVTFHFDENAPLYVVDMGYHPTPPKHLHGPAVRPYFLLHLIVKGKGCIERKGVVTELGEGQSFLICPDETTTYWSDENEPWEYYWISFYGSYAETILKETTQKLYMRAHKSGIIALQTAIANKHGDSVSALHTLFSVLTSVQDFKIQTEKTDAISAALHYLENNYFQPIDVKSVASAFGFSRTHFSTLFAQKTGETPYNYLTKVRIQKAKEYLQEDRFSIQEIAYSVGFSCIGRFSELFKKYEGVSPLAYRKAFLNS